jgi:putative NADH-flavin reductase
VKIFLLGATGDSGRRILRLALRRAHEVTAFVRDERKLLSLIDRHQTCTCLLRDCADISAESRNGVCLERSVARQHEER